MFEYFAFSCHTHTKWTMTFVAQFSAQKQWESVVAFPFYFIVFIPFQLSDDDLLFGWIAKKNVSGCNLDGRKCHWFYPNIFIISLCNHFKIDSTFRYLIFSLPFKSSVSPFFCDIPIMIVNDSRSVRVNFLKRLSFPSSRLQIGMSAVLSSVPHLLSVAIFAKSSFSLIIQITSSSLFLSKTS